VLDAIYLPPAAQGDVLRAALRHPQAIGIIDGYFERVPAVWHKEILWALSQGIHVFGSASIGALRAAELAAFGMEGVGAIFAAYRDGMLEDDDEVAIAHGTAELGFRPLSIAMVNIRRTLEAAQESGVIAPATGAALARIAKALYYPDRTYPHVLERAAADDLPANEIAQLSAWLPGGALDQKRDDALAMLRTIRDRLAAGLPPKQVRFHFEHTDFWERAKREAGEFVEGERGLVGLPTDDLLDELRLDPGAYWPAWQAALPHALARALAEGRSHAASSESVRAASEAFRRSHSLHEPAALARWLAARELDRAEFGRLMEGEAILDWAERSVRLDLPDAIRDNLRLSGDLASLRARARRKHDVLETRGEADLEPGDMGLTPETLLRWYFAERLGRAVPADLAQYATEYGFRDEDEFVRAVLREYCYLRA
jgi:hypothetical protein